MSENVPAADLPPGSVVTGVWTTWTKDRPNSQEPWTGTDGTHRSDHFIQRRFGAGARVTRVGDEPKS